VPSIGEILRNKDWESRNDSRVRFVKIQLKGSYSSIVKILTKFRRTRTWRAIKNCGWGEERSLIFVAAITTDLFAAQKWWEEKALDFNVGIILFDIAKEDPDL